jgi:hypothetical protein
MSLVLDDPFWAETAAFIRETIGLDRAYVAPREFRDALPTIVPYDWVLDIEPVERAAGVVLHKGLMHELPIDVLQLLNAEWKGVFANAVFIVFVPLHSRLPLASDEHIGAFRARLQSLEAAIVRGRAAGAERTALLVIASHPPARLERTLRSLSLLHRPILVVDARSGTTVADNYRDACFVHRAELEKPATPLSAAAALAAGVRRLLDDVEVGWIASFDDTMLVRPDFLKVMERFRDREACPVLSGDGSEAVRTQGASSRDGFRLVSVRKASGIHLYAHRGYWGARFGLGEGRRNGRRIRIVAGLVTRVSE